jgi:hypothetical protein
MDDKIVKMPERRKHVVRYWFQWDIDIADVLVAIAILVYVALAAYALASLVVDTNKAIEIRQTVMDAAIVE